MSEVRLDWLRGKTFVGTDSTRHAVVLSSSDESNGTGMKPSDLLLLAVASCASVDVIEILNKKRQAPDGMEVHVEGTQDPDPPWTFRSIRMRFLLRGENLQPSAVEQAIRLAEGKYCSVSATIRATAEISTSFEIQPPARRAEV
ncbi:MAG: OsmC family protein [Anaerolineales bacterium]|nr:OsmC family protein [Anaerolineales bacterium]